MRRSDFHAHFLFLVGIGGCVSEPESAERQADTGAWSDSVRHGLDARRFAFSMDEKGAALGANGVLRVRISTSTVVVTPDGELSLALAQLGRGTSLTAVPPAPVQAGACTQQANPMGECIRRVELVRPTVTEWWANTTAGFEQGFVLPIRPEGMGSVTLSLTTTAPAHLAADTVVFDVAGGQVRYGGLFAFDAHGATLPATFRVVSDRIEILVDDTDAAYPITIDPTLSSASWTAVGSTADDQLGFSVAGAGDVDGDGYDDVLVSAPYANNPATAEGIVYLYRGSSSGLATTASWSAEGGVAQTTFGYSVDGAGDVNGDGYDDVIIGAPYYANGQASEGRAVIYWGSSSGLGSSAGWSVESQQTSALMGWSVAGAGDVDNDGYADVVIGIPSWDGGHKNEGRVSIFLGGPSGPGTSADAVRESLQNSAYLGYSVAGAGDINGDGYDDVAAGGWYYDDPLRNEGVVDVWHGGPSGPVAVLDWSDVGGQAYAYLGASIAGAGDVDGDGYGDLLVGAPGWDTTAADVGQARLYFGGSSGLGAAGWTVSAAESGAGLGGAVAGAGDVDGDGLDDLLIGASAQDDGIVDQGWAGVYYGDLTSPSTTAVWSQTGGGNQARYGFSVAGVGDIDRDGLCDIVIGSPRSTDTASEQGVAMLYGGYYDTDGDGYPTGAGGDCDDGSLDVYPGAPEVTADGIDQDCDGVDECYLDADGDGEGTSATSSGFGLACDGAGESTVATDCDDADDVRFASATEIPGDGIDEDCDGAEVCYADADGDGSGGAAVVATADGDCADAGEAATGDDCDDTDAAISPAGAEIVADGIDEDCDGRETCYRDNDHDSYGSSRTTPSTDMACDAAGEADNAEDCNDLRVTTYPGAPEIVGDGIDEDCDGSEQCFEDSDGDGVGSAVEVPSADGDCSDAGESLDATDCNDDAASVTVGGVEIIADGIDEDCDGGETCFADADGDGAPGRHTVASADLDCDDPGEYTATTDCDDLDPIIFPGAVEALADGIDQDCDGGDVCFSDGDLDGYGAIAPVSSVDRDCGDPGEATNIDDCDDRSGDVHPFALDIADNGVDEDCDGIDAATEIELPVEDTGVQSDTGSGIPWEGGGGGGAEETGDPGASDAGAVDPGEGADSGSEEMPSCTVSIEIPGDAIDQDCDGGDTCFADLDGDLFGGAGFVFSSDLDCDDVGESPVQTDCDDWQPEVYPGATEGIADGVDQDCDGGELCYADTDGDHFGGWTAVESPDLACAGWGEADVAGDCDDEDAATNPRALDVGGNGMDEDCDGSDAIEFTEAIDTGALPTSEDSGEDSGGFADTGPSEETGNDDVDGSEDRPAEETGDPADETGDPADDVCHHEEQAADTGDTGDTGASEDDEPAADTAAPSHDEPAADTAETCAPAAETCNGIDDDCDGLVDEGCAGDSTHGHTPGGGLADMIEDLLDAQGCGCATTSDPVGTAALVAGLALLARRRRVA